jgi:hypothetical protein
LTRAAGRVEHPSFEGAEHPTEAMILHLDSTKELQHDTYMSERCLWNTDSLCLDVALGEMARSVVLAAGLDPASATAEQMDARDLCFRCAYPECELRAMVSGWRSAVS